MPIRTTVDLPEEIHSRLTDRAQESGTSLRALIVRAIENTYPGSVEAGRRVTGPMVRGRGQLGPRFPVNETPHDLILP